MIVVCFPGRALSNDLINLPTVAFIKSTLESGAGICRCAFCLITEMSTTEREREIGVELGDVASCAKSWACIFPGIFEWAGDQCISHKTPLAFSWWNLRVMLLTRNWPLHPVGYFKAFNAALLSVKKMMVLGNRCESCAERWNSCANAVSIARS